MLSTPLLVFSSIFLVAFLMPLISMAVPTIRLPTAILEILCGVLIGRSGLRIIASAHWISGITQLGLLYLMFLAGLEIRFSNIPETPILMQVREDTKSSISRTILISAVSLLTTLALALLAGHVLQAWHLAAHANVTALLFATTSLGIIVPTLKENGLTAHPLGQSLLMSALFADFVTVALASFVLKTDMGSIGHGDAFFAMLSLGGILFIGGTIFLRLVNGAMHASARTAQLGVRGALAIMGICGAAALELHQAVILGGFIAGGVCSLLARNQHEALRKKLEILGYGLFLPAFFITVGLDLDLTRIHFAQVWSALPLYIALAFAVKIGASLAFRPFFTGRESTAAGILLSTRFTLVIAVTMTAQQLGLMSGTEEGTLILTALFTVLVAPLIFTLIMQSKPSHKSIPDIPK